MYAGAAPRVFPRPVSARRFGAWDGPGVPGLLPRGEFVPGNVGIDPVARVGRRPILGVGTAGDWNGESDLVQRPPNRMARGPERESSRIVALGLSLRVDRPAQRRGPKPAVPRPRRGEFHPGPSWSRERRWRWALLTALCPAGPRTFLAASLGWKFAYPTGPDTWAWSLLAARPVHDRGVRRACLVRHFGDRRPAGFVRVALVPGPRSSSSETSLRAEDPRPEGGSIRSLGGIVPGRTRRPRRPAFAPGEGRADRLPQRQTGFEGSGRGACPVDPDVTRVPGGLGRQAW